MNIDQTMHQSQESFPEGTYLQHGFGLGCILHVVIQRSPIGIFKDYVVYSISYEAAVILDYVFGWPIPIS